LIWVKTGAGGWNAADEIIIITGPLGVVILAGAKLWKTQSFWLLVVGWLY